MNHFADRLTSAIREKNSSVCVGLDPVLDRLPETLRPETNSPQQVANAFARFCIGIIDVVAPLVPVVKPQIAFFELYGAAGWDALRQVISHARSRNLIVVADAKRGDIGNTAAAYAECFLSADSPGDLHSDSLTVNPYMGDDALQPFIDTARSNGNGLFVLVKTSNPGGKLFQDLAVASDGRPLYQHVADFVEAESAQDQGKSGYGNIGAVVGATYPEQLSELRELMPHTYFLIPGFGAQGGKATDLRSAFDDQGFGAIINNSRNIIFAHSRPEFSGEADWQRSVELATREMISQLA